MENNVHLIDQLFRTEYGKLVSTLTRLFGTAHIQLAEDVVQDALIAALDKWSVEGIPKNPSAWLMQVAKRKALNELKRNQMMLGHELGIANSQNDLDQIGTVFMPNEIEDSQLRMIFTCCHPALNTESQIALTLKTLCGFGIQEVANALLSSKSTINKRLFRAKEALRKMNAPFTIPSGAELNSRLQSVTTTLYLLFNEGYNASSGDNIIQKEFCLEALRLCKLLEKRFTKNPEIRALLALMCFHVSRFDARLDTQGGIIIFEEQDRSLWNKKLIQKGMQYLQASMNETKLTSYHLEAGIAGQHCIAESFEKTDWKSIYANYQLLEKLKPSPIIRLNLAIIQSKLTGLESSLALLGDLESSDVLNNYHLLPATQGIFLLKLGQEELGKSYLQKALKMATSKRERDYIKSLIH